MSSKATEAFGLAEMTYSDAYLKAEESESSEDGFFVTYDHRKMTRLAGQILLEAQRERTMRDVVKILRANEENNLDVIDSVAIGIANALEMYMRELNIEVEE